MHPNMADAALKQDPGHSRTDGTAASPSNTDRSAENRRLDGNAVAGPLPTETIFIPLEARGKLLSSFSISVRLEHIFESLGLRLVSDLHGRTISEFRRCRNCGKKSLDELQELVGLIQHQHHATGAGSQIGAVVQEETVSVAAGAFFVPVKLREVEIADLPMSVRLDGALQQKSVRCLGDLHGVRINELKAIGNCGRKTVSELILLIERTAAGEFSSAIEIAWDPAGLVRTIDELVAALSDRNEEILILRLGGKNDDVLTLEEVGAKFGLTRERVRQIVVLCVHRILKHGSRRLRCFLEYVEAFCSEKVCPLTTALVKQWLQQSPAAGKFRAAFYVRLIGELKPTIPAWPVGHEPSARRAESTDNIERELESLLREGFQARTLSDVLQQLRTRAATRKVNAIEFLSTLQNSRLFKVEFPQPNAPIVRLARRSVLDVATVILQSSDAPLTSAEILARANSLVGTDVARWSQLTFANAFIEDKGFYLLGPRSYGLRKHFSVPEQKWEMIRTEFLRMLTQENRPVSTVEVVSSGLFKWAEKANAYELACILRKDSRVIDLGRFLFALAKWGIEEREYIKDLIPKVLQEAGRPLTGNELLARLQQLRSASPTSISGSLRKHPEIRNYGFGLYGLKSWGDSVKSRIVADAAIVERVIQRAAPPLTFARLCSILEVPPVGELSERLWQNCAKLSEIVRIPEERSDTSLLIHESCGLERALVATAREIKSPMALYEFQWALNDRFGALFATKSLDELRRSLEQSPMFLRNAADEFILDINVDQLGLDGAAIRQACAEILSESNEIVGCEDLLERLEAVGKSWEELSPDILASLLREGTTFQEVGYDRFRVRTCKR